MVFIVCHMMLSVDKRLWTFIIFHPSCTFILIQGQGNFALCADRFFSRSLSTAFNFVEEFCCSHWFRRKQRCLMVTQESRGPAVPPSPCVQVAAPMSEVWDRKRGHPTRQFNKRVRQGPAPSQKVSVTAQCFTDNYPFPTFLS